MIDRTSFAEQSAENAFLVAYDSLVYWAVLRVFACAALYPQNVFHIDLGQDLAKIWILVYVTY